MKVNFWLCFWHCWPSTFFLTCICVFYDYLHAYKMNLPNYSLMTGYSYAIFLLCLTPLFGSIGMQTLKIKNMQSLKIIIGSTRGVSLRSLYMYHSLILFFCDNIKYYFLNCRKIQTEVIVRTLHLGSGLLPSKSTQLSDLERDKVIDCSLFPNTLFLFDHIVICDPILTFPVNLTNYYYY